MTAERTITRTASAGFGLCGVAMVIQPERAIRLLAADQPEPPTWVVRLLGGRLIMQHALIVADPVRGSVVIGAIVDCLHALSMVGVAALWREYRRPALVSAATAAASAAVGMATAPRATPR